MRPTVAYGRVSTDDQAEIGLSIPAQFEACESYAARHDCRITAYFRDEGVSAGKPLDKRPGLAEAISVLEPGGVLLVAKRDRIFRADPFECALIERAVRARGARILSAAGEGTEDDSPGSVLMRRLLDAFGEYERLLIGARTRAVLQSKRRRGEISGPVPYGSRRSADGIHLEACPEDLEAAAEVRRLRQSGRSIRQVAADLNARGIPTKRGGPWAYGSVSAILKRFPCPDPPNSSPTSSDAT